MDQRGEASPNRGQTVARRLACISPILMVSPRGLARFQPILAPARILHLQPTEAVALLILEHGLSPAPGMLLIFLSEIRAEYMPGRVRLTMDARQAQADGIIFEGNGTHVSTRGWAGFLPAKYFSFLNEIRPLQEPIRSAPPPEKEQVTESKEERERP